MTTPEQAGTIWQLVEARAEASPDATVLIDERDNTLTFAQLRDEALATASGLAAMGVGEGTPVTWMLPTTMDAVVTSLALARLGALQNPILHIYRERELGVAIRRTQPDLVVVPGDWMGTDFVALAQGVVDGLPEDVPTPTVLSLADGRPTGDPATLAAFVPPEDPATTVRWIYYTSGTTSEPKGVRHTDATLLAGGRGLAAAVDLGPGDVGSMAFPYAHIAGPDYLIMCLHSGFPAVLIEAFNPPAAVETFNRHGVTMIGGSTAFYQMFLAEQAKTPGEKFIPTLKLISGGGAPKPPELAARIRDEIGVPVCHGYGMTEVPMISQGSPRDTEEQLANTEGAPVPGAQVRIVTENGEVAPPGVEGEVRLKGPMVCLGYTDPEATAAAFDADGWFRTGDLGILREDGHLALTGRLKDVIIRKGENISAKEVEDLLFTHPKVGDVAVIGLPDEERGERVAAVVERAGGADDLTFAEMSAHLQEAGLMTRKIPEQLEVVDALPRNETLRKVLKFKLRESYAEAPWSPQPR
ncbi:MAG: AMP-binding protein [Microthrixaceae bacterium]